MSRPPRLILALAMLTGSARVAIAQGQPAVPDLMTATLEELMNVEITSASRKVQRAADVAGAIHVITLDDLRRSGMTTVRELLRLVPGVQGRWGIHPRRPERGFHRAPARRPRATRVEIPQTISRHLAGGQFPRWF